MDDRLERIGDAFRKYSINPNSENLKILQELTGRTELPDVLDVTDSLVKEAMDIRPLHKLQIAVSRLDGEKRILLDKRVQLEAHRRLNGKSVCSHLKALGESIKLRIRHLTKADDVQKKHQSKIFGMCCQLYQEKIKQAQIKLLGHEAYEIVKDPEFIMDAKRINEMSKLTDPQAKLAFFQEHMYDLQDKYLPYGQVLPAQLCQLIIITLAHAENPELLHDITEVSNCLLATKGAPQLDGLVRAAKAAVCVIQEESLPDLATKYRLNPTN